VRLGRRPCWWRRGRTSRPDRSGRTGRAGFLVAGWGRCRGAVASSGRGGGAAVSSGRGVVRPRRRRSGLGPGGRHAGL